MRTACRIFLVLFLALPGAAFADRDDLTQISTIGPHDGRLRRRRHPRLAQRKRRFRHRHVQQPERRDGAPRRRVLPHHLNGSVELPGPETKTPFASVTFFDADRTALLGNGITFAQFAAKADNLLPTPNIFYAVKITGTFEIVRARSVVAQDKPYKPLLEVVKNQALFDFARRRRDHRRLSLPGFCQERQRPRLPPPFPFGRPEKGRPRA